MKLYLEILRFFIIEMLSWNSSSRSIPITSSFSSDGLSGSLNKAHVLQNASSMQPIYTTERSTRSSRDMPYNSSTFRDPYMHQSKLSNDTTPRKNYAPMNQQLADQLSTRNIHPLARYASSNADVCQMRTQDPNYSSSLYSHTPTTIQYYPNMLGNDLALVEVGKAQNNIKKFLDEGSFTCLKPRSNASNIDMNEPITQRLRSEQISAQRKRYLPELTPQKTYMHHERPYNRNFISSQDTVEGPYDGRYDTRENILAPQPDIKRRTELNTKVIDDLMFKYSNVGKVMNEENRSIAELNNNRNPVSTVIQGSFSNDQARMPVESFQTTGLHSTSSSSIREAYKPTKSDTYMDEVYLRALEAKIVGIVHYLKTNPTYSPWKDCWDRMEKNIRKNGFNFQRLDESDQDIAFVIDKGVKKSFRIRGEDRRYIPLNIEQYVLYHEMAHLANNEFGHGAKFCMLLSIICLAGYECGYIDLKRMSKTVYMTNSQPILCQADMKHEISDGIGHIIKKNPNKEEHYREFLRFINAQ